jgi:hypothetical protein
MIIATTKGKCIINTIDMQRIQKVKCHSTEGY